MSPEVTRLSNFLIDKYRKAVLFFNSTAFLETLQSKTKRLARCKATNLGLTQVGVYVVDSQLNGSNLFSFFVWDFSFEFFF